MTPSPNDAEEDVELPPDDAFACLSNETRVDILQALWEEFESGRGGHALPYAELFERVDIRDSGNFSYHLERLTGPFVRRTEVGYELKQTGINVVRAVVAGTVTVDRDAGPAVVDVDCPLCGGAVSVEYADEFLNVACLDCPGRRRWRGEPGHLFGALVPPVGVERNSIDAAFRAAVTLSLHEMAVFYEGVCPHCLGSVTTTLDVCTDHDSVSDSLCASCGRRNVADAWLTCPTCKRSLPPPASVVVLVHPEVTAFYHDHGVEHRFSTWATVARSFELDEHLVSEDPVRLRYDVPAGDDELRLLVDETLRVVEATA